MKTKLITNLKKNVLLVDGLPEKEIEEFFENEKIVASDFRFDEVKGNWKLLGKIKDLTESDCEPLVEGNNGEDKSTMWFDYIQPKTCFFCFTKESSKESFLSALEAENVVLSTSQNINPEIQGSMVRLFAKMKEAEQNVFSPETLVFVEQ